MTLVPRPYQQAALDALYAHICEKKTNPCIVLPTGSGKSACIAWSIQHWKEKCPWFRCCIVQHRKELIEQNVNETKAIYPDCDIGVYSAALNQREYDSSILFASIDSISHRAGQFAPWDVVMVDESHRIPFNGEGRYRTFIKESRKFNPDLRVIGWTATPFRMAGGQICGKDYILNEVCYEAKITDLINDGYLCQLRSKVGETQPELKGVKRNARGDYIIASLAKVTNHEALISRTVAEAARIIEAENRRSVVFFCVDIEHCQRVSYELRRHGINAPFVTSKTKSAERDHIARGFRSCRLRAICNVNVYTEGFNAPNIDCIVLLRPTLSPGLFSQMVGRGSRTCAAKLDCLILDFAGCIEEHGPVDLLGGVPVVVATCMECRESFSRAIRRCPACGWEIPKLEIEQLEIKERHRRLHGDKASKRSILSSMPETYKIDEVTLGRHRKKGSPDSIAVQYRSGIATFKEWICLDHEGFARKKALEWCGKRGIDCTCVSEVLQDMFASQLVKEWTKTITVIKKGQWFEIVDYNRPVVI
ncbi:hypothetical protein LCGC14_1226380 [marine sediment metagenome]|uniref:Helicase ATP-binding domain-containing protein n=1 Tax=marine sediment metagenome TaxID=412755 RepID=A0A0F9L9S5_9ZZZZ